MPVTLSIKNVPDEVAQRLRDIAAANHRSLQGELLATIVAKAAPPPGHLTLREIYQQIGATGLATPAESAGMIRADRDSR